MPKLNEKRLSPVRKAQPFKIVLPQAKGVYGSREVGWSLFNQFWSHLEGLPQDCSIPIDFRYVRFMNVSATDEFLCRILQRIRSGELQGRYVYLVNACPEVVETLDLTLHFRKLACLAEEGGSFKIIGDLSEPLSDTLKQLCRKTSATASELTAELGRSKSRLNIVCNRLNTLSQWGLVHRAREAAPKPGRQYLYQSILPSAREVLLSTR